MERRRQFALDVLVVYALAAISCSGSQSEHHRDGDAGAGAGAGGKRSDAERDSGAGTSGAGGQQDAGGRRPGDACEPNSPTPNACAPGKLDSMLYCEARYEQVQCYITSTGTCLPADDTSVVGKISDRIYSAGFQPEFVLGDAPSEEIPASCGRLLACCDQLASDAFQRPRCYDTADDSSSYQYSCTWDAAQLKQSFGCTLPDTDPAADAGPTPSEADAGAHPSLCCYRACGYFLET